LSYYLVDNREHFGLYGKYGFVVVGRISFNKKFLTADHKYAWKQNGWKEGDA
jgi:hypothetical protein